LADSQTAEFVRSENDRAVVRFAGSPDEVALRMVGSYLPQPGDVVRVTRTGSETVVDGLATPRQPVGRVEAFDAAAGTALVRTLDDKLLTFPLLDSAPDLTPGDTVVVLAGYIIGRPRAPLT
jgi:hypothetical protein